MFYLGNFAMHHHIQCLVRFYWIFLYQLCTIQIYVNIWKLCSTLFMFSFTRRKFCKSLIILYQSIFLFHKNVSIKVISPNICLESCCVSILFQQICENYFPLENWTYLRTVVPYQICIYFPFLNYQCYLTTILFCRTCFLSVEINIITVNISIKEFTCYL